MKNAVSAIGAFITATLVLSACGGSDEPRNADTQEEAAESQVVLSNARLSAALLGITDLPDGYSVLPGNPVSTADLSYMCNYTPEAVREVEVERRFQSTSNASQGLNVDIRQYESATDARSGFDSLVEALKTCSRDEESGVTYKYTSVAAPSVGEEAVGRKTTWKAGTATTLYALQGPVVISAQGYGVDGVDIAGLDELLTKQVSRYMALAGEVPETLDSDGDGEPDISDAFPFDKSETADSNKNGIGDNWDAVLKAKVAKAAFLSTRKLALVLKDPASHVDEVFKVWGSVVQFDSRTGTDSFIANVASSNTTSYGYFEGDDAWFVGPEKVLRNLIEGDLFIATVRMRGSFTYPTAAGGTNTVPVFGVEALDRQ